MFHVYRSSTYEKLGRSVKVPYTIGSWSGDLGEDEIRMSTFSDTAVRANIACINQAEHFFINESDWQGILGLGYAGIARVSVTSLLIFL